LGASPPPLLDVVRKVCASAVTLISAADACLGNNKADVVAVVAIVMAAAVEVELVKKARRVLAAGVDFDTYGCFCC
jgi:hypothetical protein